MSSNANGALTAVHAAVVKRSPCRTEPEHDCNSCPRKPKLYRERGSLRRPPRDPRIHDPGEKPMLDGTLQVERSHVQSIREPGPTLTSRDSINNCQKPSRSSLRQNQNIQNTLNNGTRGLAEEDSVQSPSLQGNGGFNTLHIHGAQNKLQKGRHVFYREFRRYGVAVQPTDVKIMRKQGYYGRFDSRRLVIQFTRHSKALLAFTSLQQAIKHHKPFKKWRITTSHELESSKQNSFHVLEDVSKDHCTNNCAQDSRYMRIGTWNISTLTGKESELNAYLTENNIHVLGITETMIRNNREVGHHFPQYQFLRKNLLA